MNTKMKFLVNGLIIMALLVGNIYNLNAQNYKQIYQKGLVKEEGEGALQEAIDLYNQIADNSNADNSLRAKALLHIGGCYEKMGKQEATKAYQRLVNNFPGQKSEVAIARERLSELLFIPKKVIPKSIIAQKVWGGPDANGIKVFISPHYYYKHDHTWKFEGALETLMHNISMFDRGDQLNKEGFEGSGADWLERYKKYIEKDFVTVVGPHKVYGPESNDLSLQLRKQKIDKVILAGMSGNLCVESHMRELIEDGFEVAVVGDATASAIVPGYDGNLAAQTNYRFIASHVYTTEELKNEFKTKH